MRKLIYTILVLFLFFPLLSFGQAKIKFDTLVFHLKPVKIGQTTILKIPFSNIGNEPLLITKCTGGNSSTLISSPNEPILPNQSHHLEIKMLNGSSGDFKLNFSVAINNKEELTLITVNTKVIDIIVSGTITDKNNQPLPGVNIIVGKTNTGTQSDIDGKYELRLKPKDTLIFSFLGYKEIKMPADKEEINLQMQEEYIDLREETGLPIIPRPRKTPVEYKILTKKETRKFKRELRKKAQIRK